MEKQKRKVLIRFFPIPDNDWGITDLYGFPAFLYPHNHFPTKEEAEAFAISENCEVVEEASHD